MRTPSRALGQFEEAGDVALALQVVEQAADAVEVGLGSGRRGGCPAPRTIRRSGAPCSLARPRWRGPALDQVLREARRAPAAAASISRAWRRGARPGCGPRRARSRSSRPRASTRASGRAAATKTRFSTWPSAKTSTTRARSGPRETNSTCRIGAVSRLGASTSEAPRVRPESAAPTRSSAPRHVAAPRRPGDGGVEPLAVLARHGADLQEAVHEEPEARLGGDAPGADMRVAEEAHVLQVLHDVADRRGATPARTWCGSGVREPTGAPVSR